MLYNNSFFSIFFGTKQSSFVPPLLPESIKFNGKTPLFLKQIHSNKGFIIPDDINTDNWQQFNKPGDYLITNQPNVVLGITTADCLPIIVVDTKKKVIANIHAGWRGSVLKITEHALNAMSTQFGSTITDLEVFFGPSAKLCCYSVGTELILKVTEFGFGSQSLTTRNGQTYFDLPGFNQLMLIQAGLNPEQINTTFNTCTMCNPTLCSYRRDKGRERQITAVWLHG